MRVFFDLDGTLAKWRASATEDDLYEKGYFANLDEEPALVQFVERICERKDIPVYILSSYLTDSKYAKEEKLLWIKNHLPKSVCPILVPYGNNKSDAVKQDTGRDIDHDDVLFDDHSPNCIEWNMAGGTSVKFINDVNGRGIKWDGLRVSAEIIENILKEGGAVYESI